MKIQDFFNKKKQQEENTVGTIVRNHEYTYQVTKKKVMNIPAVKMATTNILSFIDSDLFQLNDDNEFIETPLVKQLNISIHFKNQLKDVLLDVLFHGKGYLYKSHGNLVALDYERMTVEEFTQDNITVAKHEYSYNAFGTSEKIDESELIIFDSGSAGVLYENQDTFLSIIDYQKSLDFMAQNTVKPNGVLQAASKLSGDAITRLKETFTKMYGGTQNNGQTVILEQGLEYKPISYQQSQNTDSTKKEYIQDIARIFNIPVSLLDGNIAKYGSLVSERLSLLQNMKPYIKLIELELSNYYLKTLKFETNALILSEPNLIAENSIQLLNAGIITNVEARKLNNLPVSDEISEYFVNSIGKVLMPIENNGIEVDKLVYLNVQKSQEKETQNKNNEEMEQEKL